MYTLRGRGGALLPSLGVDETLLRKEGEELTMLPQNLDKETQYCGTNHILGYLLVAAVRSYEENVAAKLNIVCFTFT